MYILYMYLRLPRVCDKLHSFKEQIANPWLVKMVWIFLVNGVYVVSSYLEITLNAWREFKCPSRFRRTFRIYATPCFHNIRGHLSFSKDFGQLWTWLFSIALIMEPFSSQWEIFTSQENTGFRPSRCPSQIV